MAWKQYLLVFRLKSPLHIGYRKIGNLMQTRRYVPGKVLWGALTACLTRLLGQGGNSQVYIEVGNAVNENFRFSYLWPAQGTFDGEQNEWKHPESPDFPWVVDMRYFDYLFLNCYTGTAIETSAARAKEGSLHQTEYIAPVTKEGKPVFLLGGLWVQDPLEDCRLKDWQRALNLLRLGGERTYGWGIVNCDVSEDSLKEAMGCEEIECSGDDVILRFKKEAYLPAHALAADLPYEQSGTFGELKAVVGGRIFGPIEPLTGYEYRKGAWTLSPPKICYVPGSTVMEDLEVKVGAYGILSLP